MHSLIRKIRNQAKKSPKHIVFPEGEDERVHKAAKVITKEGIAKITLLGNPKKIKPIKGVEIIDPKTSTLKDSFAKELVKLRKSKGLKLPQAKELLKDMNYFGTMMVEMDLADGMVTGTTNSTADSIRPALQIIKTKEKFHKVSGVFIMALEKRLLLFADAAITVEPDAHTLTDITIDTAETAKRFGIKPKVALLSFSTKGSAKHPKLDKIREALNMIKYKCPRLVIDGELQVDAALVPEVAKKKCPKSPIKGDANILIFPDLESANIAYKLVERLAKAKAIGPLLQGLNKPVNDLSRGCNYNDIVNVTAFTSCEATLPKSGK